MFPQHHRYRTHCQVIGGSQYGKTSWAAYCKRIHILRRNRVISIDYKSGGYQKDLAFIARACPRYPAVFIDASRPDRITPYNPFILPSGRELSAHANHLAAVILKVVSNQPLSELQNYVRVAETFFAHLAVSKHPVHHAIDMLEFENKALWFEHSQHMPDQMFREEMRRISQTQRSDWKFEVAALRNRLRPFTTSVSLRRMTSLPNSVSIAECFEKGTSVFVNGTPSPSLPIESARIFLGLILSELLLIGIENAMSPKTYFVYVDEAQEYAPEGFGSTLDLALASGLLFTIIHHYAGQMDERTQQSLSVNAGIKVIFGGLDAEIQMKLVDSAFRSEMNQDLRKQPRISHVPEYDYDETMSQTEYPDGSLSVTKSDRLIPFHVPVITGWDLYSLEEKRSKLAQNFNLPKRECLIILPDGKKRFIVPTLKPYLFDSEESLLFRHNLPNSLPLHEADAIVERSTQRATKPKKRPARLHNAGG